MPALAVLTGLLVASVACAPAHAAPRVVFGHEFGPYQTGFGTAHPSKVGYGGDGVADMRHLRWRHWGRSRASAIGTGYWDWPGQGVATGTVAGRVHVVVWRIRTCAGVRMYTRMTRWIPKYGQRFHSRPAANLCRTDSYARYHETDCRDVDFSDGGGYATGITVHAMTCRRARGLIAKSPAEAYALGGGRYRTDRFFCGTDGASPYDDPGPLFGCELDRREVTFEVVTW